MWRSSLADARAAANQAIDKIYEGEAEALELKSADRHIFIRARDDLQAKGIEKEIDDVCRDHAEALTLAAGRITPLEAIRDWLRRNHVDLPKITVAAASHELIEQAKTDGKSKDRRKQLSAALDALAEKFNVQVHTITPDQISKYLAALPFVERTKKNHRDAIGYFNRWLVLRGYLPKGMDWLENVQNYSARKVGVIQIYTPAEIARLLNVAGDMTPFIAIGAFAGLRHAEIDRLDWAEIDLEDGFIEVSAAKSKTGERRLVPIHDNLRQWLENFRKKTGRVAPYFNTTKQLLSVAAKTGHKAKKKTAGVPALVWKHNALRHSFISYRVAECADVPRVSDEAGNSPAMIRQHYLRRVKPANAAEWFGTMPPTAIQTVIHTEASVTTTTSSSAPSRQLTTTNFLSEQFFMSGIFKMRCGNGGNGRPIVDADPLWVARCPPHSVLAGFLAGSRRR